jgi:hypothetical protein
MRLMRLVVGVLLGVLLVPDSAKAQSLPSDWTEKLDSYVNEAMTSWNIPGLSLAVVRDGEIAYMQGYRKPPSGSLQSASRSRQRPSCSLPTQARSTLTPPYRR